MQERNKGKESEVWHFVIWSIITLNGKHMEFAVIDYLVKLESFYLSTSNKLFPPL